MCWNAHNSSLFIQLKTRPEGLSTAFRAGFMRCVIAEALPRTPILCRSIPSVPSYRGRGTSLKNRSTGRSSSVKGQLTALVTSGSAKIASRSSNAAHKPGCTIGQFPRRFQSGCEAVVQTFFYSMAATTKTRISATSIKTPGTGRCRPVVPSCNKLIVFSPVRHVFYAGPRMFFRK